MQLVLPVLTSIPHLVVHSFRPSRASYIAVEASWMLLEDVYKAISSA